MNVFWPSGMAVLTAAGAILLSAAGAVHAARPAEHRAVLRVHRLFPPRWAPPVAAVATGAELVTGLSVLVTALSMVLTAAVQAAVYGAFAGYAAVLRTRRAGVPCGCFGAERVSWAAVGRAAVLAAGSAGYAAIGPISDPWPCVAAGVVLAMAIHLPVALRGMGGRRG
ncbi:MauE/DoxX family redox-associated membrane protein [Amycolatopsis sp. CA-128772]|uniref:MauE/DoxX family redox-associated membrane protein n=1 Tax=Amycolatopsis sp. CA-128772 TaxID=2073159 RepID=UPI000CD29283|nr:MauE/DoxX family redox-associated membrane protein [Amycolatopsis sp. CA-128772]